MRRLAVPFGIFFAALLALTPPGLCTCWLMSDIPLHHPHLAGYPEHPHRHNYLLHLFHSQAAPAAPALFTPAGLLIALQAAGGLWRQLPEHALTLKGWALSPVTPPPRFLAAFCH